MPPWYQSILSDLPFSYSRDDENNFGNGLNSVNNKSSDLNYGTTYIIIISLTKSTAECSSSL